MKSTRTLPPQPGGEGSGSSSRDACRSSRAKLDPSLTSNIRDAIPFRSPQRGWRSANCSGDFRADSELLGASGDLEHTGSLKGAASRRKLATSATSDGLARSKTLGMKLRKSVGGGNSTRNGGSNWLSTNSSSVTLGSARNGSSSPGSLPNVSRYASNTSELSDAGLHRNRSQCSDEMAGSSCGSLSTLDFKKVDASSRGWASSWYIATTNELRVEFDFLSRALMYVDRNRSDIKECQLKAFFAWFLPFAEQYAAHLDFVDYTLLPLIKRKAGLIGQSMESEGLHVQLMLKISKLKQLEKSIGSRVQTKVARDVARQGVAFVCMALESITAEETHDLALLDKHGVEKEDLPFLQSEQLAQYFKETNLLPTPSETSRTQATWNKRVIAHMSKRASLRRRSNLLQLLEDDI
mmetsp:Transcript_12058/g.26325  ORF Transcript_12058/g.26325 Transcript_12058/m.26325 type:complete len:409 (-) Transcript_12058:36-1262(-)